VTEYLPYIYAAVAGYLLGSIPFGLLLTGAAGLGDVRKIGSGNIGATNVLRTGRRDLAIATLLLDVAKGAAAVLIVRWWLGNEIAAMVAGAAAFLGHLFPVWLSFKGGKGVATYIGVLVALNWIVGLIFCATCLVIAVAQRYSSLAAITAAATSPIFAYVFAGVPLAATAAILALILIIRHRTNIVRLLNNTEPKISFGSKPST
jgi:glycerol-3-phosphate acyltransferase PlsY